MQSLPPSPSKLCPQFAGDAPKLGSAGQSSVLAEFLGGPRKKFLELSSPWKTQCDKHQCESFVHVALNHLILAPSDGQYVLLQYGAASQFAFNPPIPLPTTFLFRTSCPSQRLLWNRFLPTCLPIFPPRPHRHITSNPMDVK